MTPSEQFQKKLNSELDPLPNVQIYHISRRKGIDDLKWHSFVFDCELTEEAAKEIEECKKWNEDYIERLHKSGEYGDNDPIEMKMLVDFHDFEMPTIGNPCR